MPELMEVIVHNGEDLPFPELPYYALAQEGLFLHRNTAIGTVLVPEKKLPYTVGSVGEFKKGAFTWSGAKIPGVIIAQATAFFRRVYDAHKTEAEVLITKHNTTGEYRLFIPYQRVNGAAVKSVYEPNHIDPNYIVVGTLHSHCHFSAFHSGTDSADASDMDGVHFTIGMLQNNPPQIVAMVVMNKVEFHFPDPTEIAELVFEGHEPPLWWDQYIYPASSPAEKPKGLRSITETMWNEFRGIVAAREAKKSTYTPALSRPGYQSPYAAQGGWQKPSDYRPKRDKDTPDDDWDNWGLSRYGMRAVPFQPTNESKKFNKHRKKETPDPRWGVDGALITTPEQDIDAMVKAMEHAELMGILTEADWIAVTASRADTSSIVFWQKFFSEKMDDVADTLDILGMTAEFSIKPKKIYKQLPGQTTMESIIKELSS